MPKTIFHSSEKSNFILNMTEEQFSKYEEAEKQRMERFGRGPRRQQ